MMTMVFGFVPDALQQIGTEVGQAWPLFVALGGLWVVGRYTIKSLRRCIRAMVLPAIEQLRLENTAEHAKSREDLAKLHARMDTHARDEEITMREILVWQVKHEQLHLEEPQMRKNR